MKKSIYDQPIMSPNWTVDEILDVFVHNRDFALQWHSLMSLGGKGRAMPIEQQEKIIIALRQYIDMLSIMLHSREIQLQLDQLDHNPVKTS